MPVPGPVGKIHTGFFGGGGVWRLTVGRRTRVFSLERWGRVGRGVKLGNVRLRGGGRVFCFSTFNVGLSTCGALVEGDVCGRGEGRG